MANKTLFWSFYVSFCTFYASLRLTRTVFSRLKIKVRPKGLHNFAFYILIYDFSLQPLMSMSASTYVLIRPPFPPPYSLLLTPYSLFLRAYKAFYNCRETFTDVMSALQINLFMQNKANFRKSQMNVTKVLTKDYEKRTLGQLGKTNPIQTQYKANSNPKQTQLKPKQTQFKPKQTQYKPNFQPQKIDGPVQIAKISENVCFDHIKDYIFRRYRP